MGCFDADQDTWADLDDSFPLDNSQWNDTDNDGFGDNAEGTTPDSCPSQFGNSSSDSFGCTDTDGDTWSDSGDAFPSDTSEWSDNDSDGFGDNIDNCPLTAGTSTNGSIGCLDDDGDSWSNNNDFLPADPTQWLDTDGDGYGDNPTGTDGDQCSSAAGTATLDLLGCPDNDLDGWSNSGDAFPEHRTQHEDGDGDGFGDNNSPGAELPDHWPEDPARNTAEVLLSCDPDEFNVDLAIDSSLTFTCTITNMIQNELAVIVVWESTNSIDAGVRTHILVVPGEGVQTVAFSGQMTAKGTKTPGISASEPGSESTMATTSIKIKTINSDDGETFDDLLEQTKDVPHIQEIIAVSLALILGLFLAVNGRRNSKRRKSERVEHLNRVRADRFVIDENSMLGGPPPRF